MTASSVKSHVVYAVVLLAIISGCREEPRLFELLPPEKTGVTFVNSIKDDNFLVNALSFDNVYNGGGVAIGDVNNDGLQDIFFTGNMSPNRLYLNRGNMQFEDVTEAAGLKSYGWRTGVAMADVNGDGWLDIYILVGGTSADDDMANQFYLNRGLNADGIPTFEEVAEEWGIADRRFGVQAAFFDYDLDGDLDLYVLNNALENDDKNVARPRKKNGEAINTDRLYRNNGDNTFTDVSEEAGILVEGYGLGVSIRDFNLDGWPDIYCTNDFLTNDVLYINNQDGTFTDRAAEYFKHQVHSGMGNDAEDFNNDGFIDIIALDMLPEDRVREKLMLPPASWDFFKRTLALGYTPQYMRNMLQLNNGWSPDGRITFSEIGRFSGIHATDWSWSSIFADFDNDGWKDLFITNGHRKDLTNLDFVIYGQRTLMMGTEEAMRRQLLDKVTGLPPIEVSNYVYQNAGNLKFIDKTKEWGLYLPSISQGSAFADLDNDGDLDLVVNNIDTTAFLYKNRVSDLGLSHFLSIQLEGPALNPGGFGAKITIRYGGKMQYVDYSPFRGFQSTVGHGIHFGLGKDEKVDSLEIVWPDGRYQVLTEVASDQFITLRHADATLQKTNPPARFETLFVETPAIPGLQYRHVEHDVNDFIHSPLLPHKLSQFGPGIAIGDVDGNGLDDVFIGSDRGAPKTLLVQTSSGVFEPRPFPADTLYEDLGALFFDADLDGDLDLYIVSGGNFPPDTRGVFADRASAFDFFTQEFSRPLPDSTYYQDRLYLNDGQGNFVRDEGALPDMYTSGSVVTGADFDGDGDIDLFVGGRLLQGRYPLPPRSYLLRNDSEPGGQVRFTDVTASIAPDLAHAGMVTTALWSDFDQDGFLDLIVAGEWMPIRFFRYTGDSFVEATASTGLASTTGWWNSLAAGDFDNDGDIDYVAGNYGINSNYRHTPDQPVRMYAGDFDRNGTIDPVLTAYQNGKRYVVAPRDLMIGQIPGMKLRFKTYGEYARATLDRTFTERELRDATVYEIATFESSYIENLGGGRFEMRPLPLRTQMAPVNGMMVDDYDGDGNLDVLFVGNFYGPEPLGGRADASIGGLLKGDGSGNFLFVEPARSGFFVDGDAKALAELAFGDGRTLLLVTQNDDSLRVFARSAHAQNRRIPLRPNDRYAHLTLEGGATRKHEFGYGSGYLSQSSRTYAIPSYATSAVIYDAEGNERQIDLHVRPAGIR